MKRLTFSDSDYVEISDLPDSYKLIYHGNDRYTLEHEGLIIALDSMIKRSYDKIVLPCIEYSDGRIFEGVTRCYWHEKETGAHIVRTFNHTKITKIRLMVHKSTLKPSVYW